MCDGFSGTSARARTPRPGEPGEATPASAPRRTRASRRGGKGRPGSSGVSPGATLPRVKVPYGITASALCALLGWSASDWCEGRAGGGVLFGDSGAARGAATPAWPAAARLAPRERLAAGPGPLLVYLRTDTPDVRAFEAAAAADPRVEAALAPFEVVRVDVDEGVPQVLRDADLGAAAPAFLVVEVIDGTVVLRDALEPLTGAVFEPNGLVAELERAAEGRDDLAALEAARAAALGGGGPAPIESLALAYRLEAAGRFGAAAALLDAALALEARPNGPLHRDRLLREALRDFTRPDPADSEAGAVEAYLTTEADPAALYRGWSLLASSAATAAASLDDATAPADLTDLSRERWLRRLRRTTRKAYKPCPEGRLVPFATLLLERFALDPEDLDSIDRSFCRVVVRTIQREAPSSTWQVRAEALFPPR